MGQTDGPRRLPSGAWRTPKCSLARALQHLHALRRAALAGGYDPLEFDRALVAYRRAEHEAMTAREALAGAAVRPPAHGGATAEAGG